MKKYIVMITTAAVFACQACTSNESQKASSQEPDSMEDSADPTVYDGAHTSQNAIDWDGTYSGTVPCADCPGIQTTLVINADETFTYTGEYMDRDLIVEDNGKFMWHDNGSTIHLVGKEINMKLKVGENRLFMLDQEGNPIEGELADHYTLQKKQL